MIKTSHWFGDMGNTKADAFISTNRPLCHFVIFWEGERLLPMQAIEMREPGDLPNRNET